MNFQKLIILLTFLFALTGASNVFANTHHHHNGAVESELASPFDNKQEGKSLHCLLNNHHRNAFCPHTGLDKSATQKISVECHGKEAGTLPSTSFQNDYFQNNVYITDFRCLSSEIFIRKFFTTQQYLSLQDPPPEVL
ncbi:hypothetical protein JYT29_00955 [Nitrospina gracilis]|nr:hypothetical protein [Nitrospina gracilis]